MEPHCGNCGRGGHVFHQCKMPIMSLGIIAFTKNTEGILRFLMIRRKNTLGFMDFMRGKYSMYNKEYLINLLNEMTITEKRDILENDFNDLWKELWCNHSGQYISLKNTNENRPNKNRPNENRPNPDSVIQSNINGYKLEEEASQEKFNALRSGIMTHTDTYTLADLVKESVTQWEEAEWGFPKGRRNMYEKDIDCAIREFSEETGYVSNNIIENIQPFEEIFMGSNYRSYKHKYFLMYMKNTEIGKQYTIDNNEVSKVEWKTYEECLSDIRPYNLEKKRIFQDIYKCLCFCE